jgi:MoxR-like ATPase
MVLDRIHTFTEALIEMVSREMFGLDEVIRLCLAALYSGGNILLEGNPGGGKTELVKSLGRTLNLQFGRIQFTPDLMPSDITGTLMPAGNGTLQFEPGPIFANLVLADEINRATPKTQSAMLQAMAEKKVTVLGHEQELPAPFMVLATQNPIDHEGTYNLPEAQSDRFMFKVLMPIPDALTLGRIIGKRAGARHDAADAAPAPSAPAPPLPAEPAEVDAAIRQQVRDTVPLRAVESHIINLYLATNRQNGLDNPVGSAGEIQKVARQFQFGLSARGASDVMLAAKAMACLFPSELGPAAEAPHLAAVVLPALRHRLKLSLEWEPETNGNASSETADESVEAPLRKLCKLTAPKYSNYHHYWEHLW